MVKKRTNCGIYQIKNIVNNKVYIGSSSNLKSRKYAHYNRLRNNKHDNKHLQNTFNKYGEENFKWDILKEIERYKEKEELKENLLKWEQEYLNNFVINGNIDRTKCYNYRIKASSNQGIKRPPTTGQTREKMSKSRKGVPKSDEHKEKISIGNKGKKRSDETIKKLSDSHLGQIISKEARDKISSFHKGRKRNEETIEKMKKTPCNKKVLNIDTNEIFSSISNAGRHYNIPNGNISRVCKGIRNTAGGYRWIYQDK